MSLSLAAAIDDLYRDVVLYPDRWGDDSYAEWLENVAVDADGIDRIAARALRRAVRIAMKLQRFWSSSDADPHLGEVSWEARVDIAVGVPAWRPGLELAERDFEAHPSEEGFDEVRRRFRVVYGSIWMDGVDYEEWVARSADEQSG
mgnify:CR=1 FL=1